MVMSTKNLHSFIATIDLVNGKLKSRLDYPVAWEIYLENNYKPGDKIWIYSKKYYKPRSTGADPKRGNQNGYYWTVVVADIAAHTGMTPHEVHEELKAICNPVPSRLNPERTVGGSTQPMNTLEFEEYAEKCRLWAQEFLDLKIPLPNETPDGETEE